MTILSVMLIITVAFITFLIFRIAFYRFLLWLMPSRKLKLTYTSKDGVKHSKLVHISTAEDVDEFVALLSDMKSHGRLKRDGM